tara:strand:- start:58 stop:444 length:387 start_codon:yes stop_codon:yes gene_type:complete
MENYEQNQINYYNENNQEYYNSREYRGETGFIGIYLLGSILLCVSILQAMSSLIHCKHKCSEYSKYKELEEVFIPKEKIETCSICLEDYQEDDIIFKLNCNHIFHKKCFKQWSNNKETTSCPLCRIII